MRRRPDNSRLAQGPERGAELAREQLRLLPGGEVVAPVKLVEVDELGVGPFGLKQQEFGHAGQDVASRPHLHCPYEVEGAEYITADIAAFQAPITSSAEKPPDRKSRSDAP
jgi:hypothetical protein